MFIDSNSLLRVTAYRSCRARRRQNSPLLSPLRKEKMTGRTDDFALDDSRQTASDTCPLPDCELDPTIHICTGIWMGRTIIDRRCLKLG